MNKKLIIAHVKAFLFCLWPPHIFEGWQILTDKVNGKTTLIAVSKLEFPLNIILDRKGDWTPTHFKIFYNKNWPLI